MERITDPDDLLPEGLQDRLPVEAALMTQAMRSALDVLHGHGYDRVRPPLVEFERSMATRMDGVQPRRMFRFVDPASLRTLALRSDMTVQVGRIAATSLASQPRPLRLCYAGEIAAIRADDQLDPSRQKLQLGAELIGTDEADAAGEVVALAIEALRAAGATQVSVDFTLPDLVDELARDAMPLAPDRIAAVRRELDMKDAGALRAAGGEAYLPLLYAAGPLEEAIARISDIDAGGALATRIAGLRAVADRIGDAARLTLDPTERHGFEYQSWLGFTFYAEGVRSALGRGGTYAIRGSDETATGFSLYLDPLVEALDAPEPAPTLYLPQDHDRTVAARLRGEGWRTVGATACDGDPIELGCTHFLDGDRPEAL